MFKSRIKEWLGCASKTYANEKLEIVFPIGVQGNIYLKILQQTNYKENTRQDKDHEWN